MDVYFCRISVLRVQHRTGLRERSPARKFFFRTLFVFRQATPDSSLFILDQYVRTLPPPLPARRPSHADQAQDSFLHSLVFIHRQTSLLYALSFIRNFTMVHGSTTATGYAGIIYFCCGRPTRKSFNPARKSSKSPVPGAFSSRKIQDEETTVRAHGGIDQREKRSRCGTFILLLILVVACDMFLGRRTKLFRPVSERFTSYCYFFSPTVRFFWCGTTYRTAVVLVVYTSYSSVSFHQTCKASRGVFTVLFTVVAVRASQRW